MSNFKVGDSVTIVNYGNPLFVNKRFKPQDDGRFTIIKEDDKTRWVDTMPDLIGKSGVVTQVVPAGTDTKYKVAVVGYSKELYNEDQLQIIQTNEVHDQEG